MSVQFYPNDAPISLRDELKSILYGDILEPGKGRPVLIRRLTDQKCVCQVEQGSIDSNCAYCGGEGWLWSETLNTTYIAKNFGTVLNASNVIKSQSALSLYGYTDENRAVAYVEYDVFPNYERYLRPDHPAYDSIYEIKVDESGNMVRPVVRTAKWALKSVTPQHGDFGRIEFFELGLEKQNV
jgi:hypothetical protein